MDQGVRILVLAGTAWSVLIGVVAEAVACPLCATALSSENAVGGGSLLARGYFWSILTLMSVPFVLVGAVAALIVRAYRRQAGARWQA